MFVLVAKGVVVPTLITRVVRHDAASRETQPLVNVPASLVAAGVLIFLAFAASRSVTAVASSATGRLIPYGMAAMLVGFFALATRRKAVSQIVGILLVDNGIALVAFLATAGVPLIVELGASLDVLLIVVVLQVSPPRCGFVWVRSTSTSSRSCTTDAVVHSPPTGAVRGACLVAAVAERRSGGPAPRPRWLVVVAGIVLAVQRRSRPPPSPALALLRADALSAFMVIVIGVIALPGDTCRACATSRPRSPRGAAPVATRRSTASWSRVSSRPCCSRCSPPTWA